MEAKDRNALLRALGQGDDKALLRTETVSLARRAGVEHPEVAEYLRRLQRRQTQLLELAGRYAQVESYLEDGEIAPPEGTIQDLRGRVNAAELRIQELESENAALREQVPQGGDDEGSQDEDQTGDDAAQEGRS